MLSTDEHNELVELVAPLASGQPELLTPDEARRLASLIELLNEPGRDERTVYRITAADLDAIAGFQLTDEQLDTFEQAIGHSSVPEAVETVLDSITPTKEEPMDITIVTSDPDVIDTDEIKRALEDLDYFVNSITVEDRGL